MRDDAGLPEKSAYLAARAGALQAGVKGSGGWYEVFDSLAHGAASGVGGVSGMMTRHAGEKINDVRYHPRGAIKG